MRLPHFNGTFRGEISVDEMCGSHLMCNYETKIISYEVEYNTSGGTASRKVKGNVLPEDVCEDIKKYGIGYMVFFTDIRAIDASGKTIKLTSANFIATKSN